MGKKRTSEQFIEEAIAVHGNKYDYSKVAYINNVTLVEIICRSHDKSFLQSPKAHLRGQGCPLCGGTKKLTTEEFVKRAKLIHKNKYDYSKVAYTNAYNKVIIICSKHGEFLQKPFLHLSGCGCPSCNGKNRLTTEVFIERAVKKHGKGRYDYSPVIYKSAKFKVKIKCNICQYIFEQLPFHHLNGIGCPKCANKCKSTKDFIEQSIKIHGQRYDYSKSEYLGSKIKTLIGCSIHGYFEQEPNAHLSGQGCPRCAKNIFRSKGERELCEYIKSIYSNKVLENTRDYLNGKELDIFIPELKIAFEYNGEHWHQIHEERTPGYHENKRQLCKDKGIRLVEVWEKEWKKNKEKIKEEILSEMKKAESN